MPFNFKLKTPHLRPWRHLFNMFAIFSVASLWTLAFGLGASVQGLSLGAFLGASLLTGGISLLGGVFVTMITRSAFGLIQTGRIVQYFGFWLAALGALHLAALAVPFAITSGGIAALAITALAFIVATATGEVPVKGRTWLPMRRKK